jgi:hypothetical protein
MDELISRIKISQPNLVTLSPPTVGSLLAKQKLACSTTRIARCIRFPRQRKGFEGKLRGVGKTNPPRPNPASFTVLAVMEVNNSGLDRASNNGIDKMK